MFVVLNGQRHEETDGVYESQNRLSGAHQLVRPTDTYLSLILSQENAGWRVVWTQTPEQLEDGDVRPIVNSAFVAQGRLWWAQGQQMYYMELGRNPPEANNWRRERYQETGETITPWFDAGVSDTRKVALAVLAEIEGLTTPEALPADKARASVEVAAGYDFDEEEDNFETLTLPKDEDSPVLYGPADFWTILEGKTRLGRRFRAIRFRIRSVLGTYDGADFVSPDVRGLTFEYYKRLGIRQRYEYSVTVDLSNAYGELEVEQMRKSLREVIENDLEVPFNYRDEGGWETRYVKVLNGSKSELTGHNVKGSQLFLSLSEL